MTSASAAPPTGQTRVAGVIGRPVRHSLSPVIFNAAFASAGLDWVYVAFEVDDGDAPRAVDAVRTLGLVGLSVTMPHKAAVAAAVDVLSPDAAALGAVNCVARLDDGRLVGHNTDGAGFLLGLRADLGLEVGGMRVVVLGAGGAARAIVGAVAASGAADVAVVNRSHGRAEAAAAAAGPVGRVAGHEALADADLLVNATSVGMSGTGPDDVPADVGVLPDGAAVVDIVYHPLETRLLRDARARGLPAANGLGMLVGQAEVAFELWTGAEAPVSAMRDAVAEALSRR